MAQPCSRTYSACMTKRNDLLKAALSYAKYGWPVFPVHSARDGRCSCGNTHCENVGKHPRTSHGVKDATTDRDTIRGWWRKWPNANIGVATGKPSGTVVLDSDPRHNGTASLRHLEREHHHLPKGPRVKTGGGGRHYFFERPDIPVKSKVGIASGLDIRSDGGYVVAPPSRHASGHRYRWVQGARPEDIKLPKLPKWVLALVTEPVTEPRKTTSEQIPEGKRNASLTSLAGAMRRHGATEDAILAALQEHNEERCDPPLSEKEVKRIASSVSKYPPSKSDDKHKSSRATKFVASLGGEDLKFFHTPEKEPYITIGVKGHRETYRLRDQYIKRWLARQFYKRFGSAPSSNTLSDVLNLLEGIALFDGTEEDVFIRLAQRKHAIYVDLCDALWMVVKVTRKGWKVISNPHVNFRRARGMTPLPQPVRGGSIRELRPFLNVASEDDFILFVSWLVSALNVRGPFPVLVVQGEAGSAKSTAVRVVRDLVDPNTTPLRSEPREARDLMISARNSWLPAFDNVTHLTPWLSDAICRLATGGGFATRRLYTDDDEQLFDATRPVLMNGIDGTVTRGDLLDRSLVVYLPTIPSEERKPEEQFWRHFRHSQPRIFGALLDAVSCALRRLKGINLDELPRMADFARWVTAAEPALGWADGTFMRAYNANQDTANTLTLDASPIVPPLRMLCASRDRWSGTAAELLGKLTRHAGGEVSLQRSWPKNPQVLSGQLRRIAPNLRASGIDIQFDEKTSGSSSKRVITITRRLPKKGH
jgi:hypothetical protein